MKANSPTMVKQKGRKSGFLMVVLSRMAFKLNLGTE